MRPAVLVVDDEPSMRKYDATNLGARGCEVLAAADGNAALALLQERRFDLRLLDLDLPGLDGLAVLAAVRRWSGVPVLVVSASVCERDRVAAPELGADDYLATPFGVEALLARFRAALDRIRGGPNDS